MKFMQENSGIGRIINCIILSKYERTRRKNDMAGKKRRIRPFRILAWALGAGMLTMLLRFPAKAVSSERQQEQLKAAAQAYSDAQSQNNQLKIELTESTSADFVERTARRDYGYCWYGEIIYQVGNLDEIRQETEFEVYNEE